MVEDECVWIEKLGLGYGCFGALDVVGGEEVEEGEGLRY